MALQSSPGKRILYSKSQCIHLKPKSPGPFYGITKFCSAEEGKLDERIAELDVHLARQQIFRIESKSRKQDKSGLAAKKKGILVRARHELQGFGGKYDDGLVIIRRIGQLSMAKLDSIHVNHDSKHQMYQKI